MPKLTKKLIDATPTPPPGSKPLILNDSDLKGLSIRIMPTGQRSFMLYYRTGSHKERRPKLGDYPTLTPEKARDIARDMLAEVRRGGDPSLQRQDERKAATLAEFSTRFMSEHIDAKRKRRTAEEYQRLLDKHILPFLGKQRVADIDRAAVTKLHHKLRATPYQANRVLAVLSKIFNLAERWGVRPDGSNPCRHVEKYAERKVERFLSDVELRVLGETLTAIGDERTAPSTAIAAVRLLVFTGCRLNEIVTLQWDHVDLANGCLRLPDSKTGAKLVHLNAPARDVLMNLPRVPDNPYVIAGSGEGKYLQGMEKIWQRVRNQATVILWAAAPESAPGKLVMDLRERLKRLPTYTEIIAEAGKMGLKLPAGLTDVRLHDLRHSFASVGAAAGMALPIIGKLLGHTQAATTHRYAHLSADPLRHANDAIGQRIADVMFGKLKNNVSVIKGG
ncbi:tyrosine-type recombinase/integrase [Azospirillum argentinense]|uniref:Tyrosine-type recombinase/integrase n=1 Tax=Azospirillum argentinense TaxID=2970906 RepID=A0ABW8VFP9_9PROT